MSSTKSANGSRAMAVVSRNGKDESLDASRWSGVTGVGGTTKKQNPFLQGKSLGGSTPPVGRRSPLWVTRPKTKPFPPREMFGRSAPPVGRGSPLWVTRPKTKPFPRREMFGREYASRWSGMTTVGGTTKFVLDTAGLLMEAATARGVTVGTSGDAAS